LTIGKWKGRLGEVRRRRRRGERERENERESLLNNLNRHKRTGSSKSKASRHWRSISAISGWFLNVRISRVHV
jgi:hypothetical protein